MRKLVLVVVLALFAGALFEGPVPAQSCSWNTYGGYCTGGPPGTNCSWNAYGGYCN